jgi:cell division protein FtsI (penicillin-binding protein 3)
MTIAGKTGTAKAYDGNKKLMSFCGFFPAEAPEYTLIVQTMYDADIDPRPKDEQAKNNYGGGSTSALIFKEIAEKIMADRFFTPIENAIEGTPKATPAMKRGNIGDAALLLSSIGGKELQAKENEKWGDVRHDKEGNPHISARNFDKRWVPNVEGMGAKDATFLIQECGLNVVVTGYGTVKRQSIPAGATAIVGDTVKLSLQP